MLESASSTAEPTDFSKLPVAPPFADRFADEVAHFYDTSRLGLPHPVTAAVCFLHATDAFLFEISKGQLEFAEARQK